MNADLEIELPLRLTSLGERILLAVGANPFENCDDLSLKSRQSNWKIPAPTYSISISMKT